MKAKRKPIDSTLRNVRAANKKIAALRADVKSLAARVKKIECAMKAKGK